MSIYKKFLNSHLLSYIKTKVLIMDQFFPIIIEQSLLYFPLVAGAYISFSLMKLPDLSIESAYLFGGLFAGMALPFMQEWPAPALLLAMILISCAGGMVVGATSGCITIFGKIPHLLSSIITLGIYHGLFHMFSKPYASLSQYKNSLAAISCLETYPELCTIAFLFVLISIGLTFLFSTQLGYTFSIFGNNSLFLKHFGISIPYVFLAGILSANALAGLAGYFFAQTNNLVEINMGVGKSLFCISALILGRTCIEKSVSIFIPLCGTVSYFLLQQSLVRIGFNLKYFTAIQALVVLILLLLLYKKLDKKIDHLGV